MTFSIRQSTIFLSAMLAMSGLCLTVQSGAAQTYIDPSTSSPTTNTVPTAPPLNSSTSVQKKSGPLLIGEKDGAVPACTSGDQSGCSKFCLNSDTFTDATKCIASWLDLSASIGGPFVQRVTSLTFGSAALGKNPGAYPINPPSGFARIRGTGANQYYSWLTYAPIGTTEAIGLYASDSSSATNTAAYFAGRVHIDQTIAGPAGRLCLNGLVNDINCIDNWSDVAPAAVGSYLALQATNPPTAQAGDVSATGVFLSGPIIIDNPPATMSTTATCGDSFCSLNEGAGCQIDCVAPLSPEYLTGFGTETQIRMRVKGRAQIPTGPVKLLLVQSTNPTFITDFKTEFVPIVGTTYSAGTIFGTVKVVYAAQVSTSATNIIVYDTVGTTPTTYYYRLYQANLLPVYNSSPATGFFQIDPSCLDATPPNGACI